MRLVVRSRGVVRAHFSAVAIGLTALALVGGLGIDAASAHVAPAVDANNRYLRVTPMRDRVRLAYTVYIGEVPGAKARKRMDSDRDGTVGESESRVYGDDLGAAVAPALTITLDEVSQPLQWSEIHVGMGTPSTVAGSFSIDLVGWICTGDTTAHSLSIFDRYNIPQPGETEVKVQTSPGIAIDRSTLGADTRSSQLAMEWRGNNGPMASMGLYVDYTVDQDQAQQPPGDHCRALQTAHGDAGGRNWLLLGGLLAVAAIAFALFVRRRLRSAE